MAAMTTAENVPLPVWRRLLRDLGARAIDAVLPPRCLRCGATVDAVGALCPACWSAMAFLGAPHCACCGYPSS